MRAYYVMRLCGIARWQTRVLDSTGIYTDAVYGRIFGVLKSEVRRVDRIFLLDLVIAVMGIEVSEVHKMLKFFKPDGRYTLTSEIIQENVLFIMAEHIQENHSGFPLATGSKS